MTGQARVLVDLHLRQKVAYSADGPLSRHQFGGPRGNSAKVHGASLARHLHVHRLLAQRFVRGHGPTAGLEAGREGGGCDSDGASTMGY